MWIPAGIEDLLPAAVQPVTAKMLKHDASQ